MNEELKKSILVMSSGAILERADYEMGRIIDNIMDPNTKAEAKRKLVITLELTPSADRTRITSKTTAKCTLVPTEAVTTQLYVTHMPGTGEMVVVESVPEIPGQYDMQGSRETRQPALLKFA